MDTLHHSLNDLFAQLGLPSDDVSIHQFIQTHRPLDTAIYLVDAPFWTPSQSAFLREQLQADADWTALVDQLSSALRDHGG